MKYQFDGYNWLMRLDRGEQLVRSLSEFADKQKIQGGWISVVGAAAWAQIGFYNLDVKQYAWRKLDQVLEIISLSGSFAWSNGQPSPHLHGAFADIWRSRKRTRGRRHVRSFHPHLEQGPVVPLAFRRKRPQPA